MHRRHMLLLPLLAVPLPVLAAGAIGVSELRIGAGAARVRRMQARLGVSVRAVQAGLVAALNAGHLEAALLTGAELAQARRLMGERLVLLPEPVDGLAAVTRAVLPAALRKQMARALA